MPSAFILIERVIMFEYLHFFSETLYLMRLSLKFLLQPLVQCFQLNIFIQMKIIGLF